MKFSIVLAVTFIAIFYFYDFINEAEAAPTEEVIEPPSTIIELLCEIPPPIIEGAPCEVTPPVIAESPCEVQIPPPIVVEPLCDVGIPPCGIEETPIEVICEVPPIALPAEKCD